MLYYGFPAMQGILPHSFVEHFMLFSEAIWILLQTSPSSSQIDKAEELLDQFCSQNLKHYMVKIILNAIML